MILRFVLRGSGIAKLADSGLAKSKHAIDTQMALKRGYTPWMAPDMFGALTNDAKYLLKYSWKSDVCNFGIVCSEILTGNAPNFQGIRQDGILKRLTDERNPQCGQNFLKIVQKAWHQ